MTVYSYTLKCTMHCIYVFFFFFLCKYAKKVENYYYMLNLDEWYKLCYLYQCYIMFHWSINRMYCLFTTLTERSSNMWRKKVEFHTKHVYYLRHCDTRNFIISMLYVELCILNDITSLYQCYMSNWSRNQIVPTQ